MVSENTEQQTSGDDHGPDDHDGPRNERRVEEFEKEELALWEPAPLQLGIGAVLVPVNGELETNRSVLGWYKLELAHGVDAQPTREVR